MIEIEIPGEEKLQLKYLVLDYNGTVAIDGKPIEGLYQSLQALAKNLEIHVITADTHGTVKEKLRDYPVIITLIPVERQDEAKVNFIHKLGASHCISIGNGRNDRRMLEESRLGIALIQKEGGYAKNVLSADIIVTDIIDALDLLLKPLRLIATMRT